MEQINTKGENDLKPDDFEIDKKQLEREYQDVLNLLELYDCVNLSNIEKGWLKRTTEYILKTNAYLDSKYKNDLATNDLWYIGPVSGEVFIRFLEYYGIDYGSFPSQKKDLYENIDNKYIKEKLRKARDEAHHDQLED